MKINSYNNGREREEAQQATYWDAFRNHLEAIYFPGASELLDRKLIAFEYDAFKSYHTNFELS